MTPGAAVDFSFAPARYNDDELPSGRSSPPANYSLPVWAEPISPQREIVTTSKLTPELR